LDNDRLINLLPAEYLPEPEFKAFPIFAAILIILTLAYIYFDFDRDVRKFKRLKQNVVDIDKINGDYIVEAQEFIDVQANARFIRSYIGVIPTMVLQAPDYWEIYNEIERNLPDDTWVNTLRFRPGAKRGWPALTVSFFSRGYAFAGPLQTYDSLTDTPEHPTRFTNLKMNGYRRMNVGGGPAAAFEISMEIGYPLPRELDESMLAEITSKIAKPAEAEAKETDSADVKEPEE